MADMHAVTGNQHGWAIVLHIDIPDTNNDVGLNYRTALITSGLGGSTSLPDGDGLYGTISAAEKTLIEAGAIVEHAETLRLESGGQSAAQLRVTLREMYAAQSASILAELQKKLRYFGHTEARS